MSSELQDRADREEAVKPNRCYIVQAPAGSGKTTLLVRRFLTLLCEVEQPEQILAITFTRKAAEEMRDRVIAKLQTALRPKPNEGEDARQEWDLAKKVLDHNDKLGWNLLLAKERLRIKTIDAFCLYLANRLPVSSHFGAPLAPGEDCAPLYREAVRDALSAIDSSPEDSKAREAYRNMLDFCGNNKLQLIDNLCVSLQNRDLWLENSRKYLLPLSADDPEIVKQAKDTLNSQLKSAIPIAIQADRQTLIPRIKEIDNYFRSTLINNQPLSDQMHMLMQHALNHISTGKNSKNLRTSYVNGLNCTAGCWPDTPDTNYVEFYCALRKMFLSGETVRLTGEKNLTATQGFPDDKNNPTSIKSRNRKLFVDILNTHRNDLQNLFTANKLELSLNLRNDGSNNDYSEEQFEHLKYSAYLLEICYFYLREVFRRRGVCDYTEISRNAVEALGSDSAPSELALQLDSKINHILVDEYQDTSLAQLELLEKITSEWQKAGADDQVQNGRTVFMVGDPMQSIYRFRKADVGIFLRTQNQGLRSEIKPQKLRLRTNFRSNRQLIGWFNRTFRELFPDADDLSTSAIHYPNEKEDAVHPPDKDKDSSQSDPEDKNCALPPADSIEDSIEYHFRAYSSETDTETVRKDEAEYIVELVRQALQEADKETSAGGKAKTTAILFRKKKSAKYVIEVLRREGIPYEATALEPLADTGPIQDLTALTKALLHLEDRVSWLALLRSPLVGLNDDEITRLAEHNPQTNEDDTLWERISNDPELHNDVWRDMPAEQLDDIRLRLNHLRAAIQHALDVRGEQPFSRWIQGTWLALGGPRTLDSQLESGLVSEYFTYLEQLEGEGMPDVMEIDRTLRECTAEPNVYAAGTNSVKLMTMHAAKGLQFGTVILPYLEEKAGGKEDENKNGLLRSVTVYPDGQSDSGHVVFAVKADASQKVDKDEATSDSGDDESEQDGQAQQAASTSPNAVLYDFLKAQCDDNELRRLLYVAATRAETNLHLVSFYKTNQDGITPSRANGTMLRILSRLQEAEVTQAPPPAQNNNPEDDDERRPLLPIKRLKLDPQEPKLNAWYGLEPENPLTTPVPPPKATTEDITYGLAFHTLMELLDICDALTPGAAGLQFKDDGQEKELIDEAIKQQDLPLFGEEYEQIYKDLQENLKLMLTTPQGSWAIGPHEQTMHEQVVCYLNENEANQERRLDRVFFDSGKFWIIDYKTGHPYGIDPRENYHKTMELYAKLISESKQISENCGCQEIYLALVYINHKRSQIPDKKDSGPLFVDYGRYSGGQTEWRIGEPF